jgi:hypothetical protein
MRTAGLLLVAGCAAAVVAAAVAAPRTPPLAAVVGPAAVPAEPPVDPFPLRRQFLSDDQLDKLTADPRGPFRKLTKPEFEAKVRSAADAVRLARTPPQVVSATYRGRYEPGRLFGTAEWAVANPSGRPGLVPFDSLRLAVSEVKPATLFRGKPGGKELPGTFLSVGPERETTVSLEWSARGVEETDEERFELSLPAAAIGTFEFTLPADRLPQLTTAAGKRVEASGPFPGAADGERVWKWAAGGQSGLVLAVRPANTPGAEVTASRGAAYELSAGEVRAAFDFTLDSPRGSIREHTFTTDAGVVVTGVTGDGVERWKQEPADGQKAGTLSVAWREAANAVKVRVSAGVTLAGGAVGWNCPGVRPTGTLPGADAIEVLVAPELKLDGWNANDYRPVFSTTPKGLKLQFTGQLAAGPDNTRRPPTVRVRSAEPEVATDEQLAWRVEPGRTRLSATVKLKVLRGPLPQVVFRTPAGYALESAALVPEDPAVTFGPLPGTPNAWVVEPSRAVPTGGTVEVRLEFRGPPGPPAPDPADPAPAAVPIPFPAFAPAAAVERLGSLTVTGDGVSAAARTVLPVSPVGGGWEVKYRGKEPTGVGLFSPDPTPVSVDAVRLAVRSGECEATLVGRADDGPVGSLTVFVPHPNGRVIAADGMAAVPLPAAHLVHLLAVTDGWSAVAAGGAVPQGVFWRVTFAKPRTGPFEVPVSYPLPAVDPDELLVLPLPHVGGGRGDLVAELSTPLAAGYTLAEGPSGDLPQRVVLHPNAAQPPPATTSGRWQFADVRQLNQVDGDGGLTVTLSGRVTQAAGRSLEFTLPAAAHLESVQIGDKWLSVPPGEELRLPLPELPADGLTFDVRYRLPTPPLGPLPEYLSPRVELPGDEEVPVRWRFASGWLPWPGFAHDDRCDGRVAVRAGRVTVLRGIGFGLGGLVLAVGVRLVLKRSRWRTAVLLAVAGGCGAAVWVGSVGWLKVTQPPLFAGLGVLLLAAFRHTPPAPARRPSSAAKLTTAALVATAGVLVHAQPAGESAVVYVVGDGQTVYAPPAVLDKLAALAAPPLPDVLLTRATYSAVADDAAVLFDATFTLECPRDGRHAFTLPLAGVRLEAMQLDGKDAFPDASKPDRYTLAVTGEGRHTLTARFAVMPATTGGDREARFTGPEVHDCRVIFDASGKGRQPDVPTRRGGQTVSEANGRWTATADHGGERAVGVRWRESAGGVKTVLSVKEAAVWDATDSPEAGVWAAFAYRVESGAVDRFEIDIPAGLVVSKVLVRSADPRATPVGVRGWRIAPSGDGTRVVARLQQPVDGRPLVLVRAVPARPLAPNPVLRFPRAAGVTDRDSVYAVRFPGVGTAGIAVSGAIDFPADAITKDFPAVPEFAFDKAAPARVVKRNPNAVTELRPTLAPTPAFTPLSAEVLFTCGAWTEVEGSVRAGVKDAGFAEFIVPDAIDVRDVRAAGLVGWGRSGNKVQVWLKPQTPEALVRWAGSLPATGELPLPRWSTALAAAEPTTVRVRAANGYAVKPTQTTGLKPKLGSDGDSAFTFEGNPPAAKVDVTPLALSAAKPAEPPPPRPPPSVTPPPSPATALDPPPAGTSAGGFWPLFEAGGWAVGLVASAVLLRGWRWRPERVTVTGLLGLLAAGVGTPLGWAFAAAAGVGVLWRLGRVVRRLT